MQATKTHKKTAGSQRKGYKKTRLGRIPERWEVKALRDVGTFSKGAGITKQELVERGIPCVRYGELYTVHHFVIKQFYSFINDTSTKLSKPIQQNDILLAGSGETREEIGKAVVYLGKEKAYAGGDIIILRPNGVNSLFLSYLLNSDFIIRHKAKLGQGYSVVHIYPSGLKQLLVPLPPLPEQRAIAAILSTWDKAIELTRQLIEKKQQLKQGLAQQLLTGEKRFKGFEGEWEEVKLGEIADIRTGAKDNQDKVENGQFPFFVRSEVVERIDSYSYEGEAILIPGEGKIGEIFHYTNGKFDYHQRVYKVSDFSSECQGKFLYYFLRQFFKREAHTNSVKATVDSLRLPTFKNMDIQLPSIEEQQQIAAVLSACDREIQLLKQKLTALQQQKKGLMQKLLTGEVRVKTS